ncbi:hypothetical protein D7Z26_15215 [Cohnella endophytica]|uniref:Yip1 domain-containing protein n=1 Tax=Cohnella endophytica TaxID=2419778 RepID=A0A494XTU6_9BACL|nr:YIP1 family protein [Cohnella endophytica]RKP53081.1 hypothetical protein D7Z26_15215 [Cohnella endophytica]
MKRLLAFLLLATTALLVAPGTSLARLPYPTNFYDGSQWLRIQAVYTPAAAFGADLEEPVDLQVGPDDKVYVADKKTDKVVVLGTDGQPIRTLGDEEDGPGKLSGPEGVFVTSDNLVYVADTGNQRIAVFGADGAFVREYKKPETTLLASQRFVPVKLVVDRRGVMYVQTSSSYQGLLRMSQDGEFMGYFGANKAQQSVLSWVKKLILNKEQLAKETPNLPKPITNVSIDQDGFIYTSTGGDYGKGAIRKLNAGGVDSFKNKTLEHGHGIVDTAIDKEGFLYNVDMDSARVNIYDRNGKALFAFGFIDNNTQQYGVLGFPTGLGVDSKYNIWIADSRTKTIQKYARTEFGSDVLSALVLYMDGKYEESKPYWERVDARNEMYTGIYQGLGKVYLHEGKYGDALDYMKEAFDKDGYSKAFWEVRLDWLQNHFVGLAGGLVAFFAVVTLGVRWLRKWLGRKKFSEFWSKQLTDLRTFGFTMFHPYQGFYKLKETKVSPLVTILILVAVLLVKILSVYETGFLFHPVDLSQIDLVRELEFFVLPWITWIIANYLVCSVKDGEGKFREVVQGSTFALMPYLFFSVPLLVLSNVVTLDEKVIIGTLTSVMTLWLGAMFIVMTQVIHNFDFMETIKNSAITVFAIGTIWLFGFIVFGLSYNLYDFFYQLYKEVSFYR